MAFFKGNIFITSNVSVVYNTPLNSNVRIISLDEDGILAENDSIIKGTCLLLPIDAKIAEADGNEQLYDVIYANHLSAPYQYDFIGALLAFLFKVGDLILFLPDMEYTNTIKKFIELMYKRYGVHIGFIDTPNDPVLSCCRYDERCLPMWLNMMYNIDAIGIYEYLYLYPSDARIEPPYILEKVIKQFDPYGNTLNEQIQYIDKFRNNIKKNYNLKPAIHPIRREI